MNTIEKEISNLKSSLLTMFLLVEGQWEKGANAIVNYDQDIAEEISSSENRINAQELKIDNDCENIIALHAPVAVDLRFILSTFKINHALEHIADIAESIAMYVADQDIPYDSEIVKETCLTEMLDIFNSMMDNVIEAFENEDPKIARKVFKKDKLINKINSEAHKIIINNIKLGSWNHNIWFDAYCLYRVSTWGVIFGYGQSDSTTVNRNYSLNRSFPK